MVVLTVAEKNRLPYVIRDMAIALMVIFILIAIRMLAGLPIVDSIINISIGAVVLLLSLFYIAKFLL